MRLLQTRNFELFTLGDTEKTIAWTRVLEDDDAIWSSAHAHY
jgi:hypothetical protein